MSSLFKAVVTLLSSHSSPSPPRTSTVMAAPPPRGPPAGRIPHAPPYPPPLPPKPNLWQSLEHLIARVDHIDRRLGQLFQVYAAINKKLMVLLDDKDVEYTSDDVSDPSLPSDNDGED